MTITITSQPCKKVNWLKGNPIAHRGLHDAASGIYENSLSACRAAMEAGYNIEVDLQPSSDRIPMVFHDYKLDRMTDTDAEVRDCSADALGKLKLRDSEDNIPTLRQLLELIQGKAGIVLELKGKPGNDDGFVEAVARELSSYTGNVAVMSFHHHILEGFRSHAPELSLGLTAEGDDTLYEMHKSIFEKTNPEFVSYELSNLGCRFVSEYLESGRPLISWTVRNNQDAAFSAKFAHQPTFEGFRA